MKPNSPISSNVLKWIAIITMVVDHFAVIFLAGNNDYALEYNICRMIGRISFPLFAFMLTEGFRHTSDIKKYMLRLGILAIVSEIPSDLAKGMQISFKSQNIFFELLIGLIVLYFIEKKYIIKNKDLSMIIRFLIIAAGAVFATLIHAEYKWQGIVVIVAFYYIKSNFILYSIAIEVSYLINSDLLLAISVIPALILVYFYNGKKGSDSKILKWFFYFFYPVHLALFVTLRYISYKYYPVSN